MSETFIDYVVYVVQHYGFVMLAMIALIEIILWLVKKPIKLLTNKIPNEVVRKIVNKIFIFMAFGLAVGLYYLGQWLLPDYVVFETSRVVITGAFAVVFYAFGDGIVIRTKPETVAGQAEELAETTKQIIEDNNVSKESLISAADSFKTLCDELNGDK